ncbi:hypothetical protein SELMODRAFT_416617 [Selaginella moellendorffii]|uniref:Peptidase S9A N-terminal domain-containing protein n=1 Tax=Selaginella moellendorffii TaxID=88036 RepID=D8RZV8_SELML|nr:hypothetical protein SELMODRAFT_416617 [Selaginella moellendorffii]
MAGTRELQCQIRQEMASRMEKELASPPERWGDWYYFVHIPQGKQFPIYSRRRARQGGRLKAFFTSFFDKNSEVMIDINELAAEHGKWSDTGEYLYYTCSDVAQRPHRVLLWNLRSKDDDIAIYHDDNPKNFVDVTRTKNWQYVLINVNSKTSSEIFLVDPKTSATTLWKVADRVDGIQYFVEHHEEHLYILTNFLGDKKLASLGNNYRLVRCKTDSLTSKAWEEVVPVESENWIEDMDIFAKHLILYRRQNGLPIVHVFNLDSLKTPPWTVNLPSGITVLTPGANCDFNSSTLRLSISSLMFGNIKIGHVTKSGEIAGPRTLEHMVDVCLHSEGDRLLSQRLLRSLKNRFASTKEVGVFEMVDNGLRAVENPSLKFLSDRTGEDTNASATVGVALEGSRPLLVEIQLSRFNERPVVDSLEFPEFRVLLKQARLRLARQDIFVNVVGGFRLEEPATDIAVAVAIASSYIERPVPRDTVFVGELGLGGELRFVAQLERRLFEASKLGFKKCIVPQGAKGVKVDGMELILCSTLKDVLEKVFNYKSLPQQRKSGATVHLDAFPEEDGVCGEVQVGQDALDDDLANDK